MGFETAIFSADKMEDDAIKQKIKHYAQTLDPSEYFKDESLSTNKNAFFNFLLNVGNFVDE